MGDCGVLGEGGSSREQQGQLLGLGFGFAAEVVVTVSEVLEEVLVYKSYVSYRSLG